MNKVDMVSGFLIGVIAPIIGSYIFIELFTPYQFSEGVRLMSAQGYLGKIITLGAIMNLIAFFILLHFKKELMARGVVLATITLTAITLFV